MLLKKFVQTPVERKRYTVDYADWLDTGETLQAVTFSVDPDTEHPLLVLTSAISEDGKSISLFVNGGDDGETYTVLVTVTTTGGQTKEDAVMFVVREP